MAKKIVKEKPTEKEEVKEENTVTVEEYVVHLEQRVKVLENRVSFLLDHTHTRDGQVVVPLRQ